MHWPIHNCSFLLVNKGSGPHIRHFIFLYIFGGYFFKDTSVRSIYPRFCWPVYGYGYQKSLLNLLCIWSNTAWNGDTSASSLLRVHGIVQANYGWKCKPFGSLSFQIHSLAPKCKLINWLLLKFHFPNFFSIKFRKNVALWTPALSWCVWSWATSRHTLGQTTCRVLFQISVSSPTVLPDVERFLGRMERAGLHDDCFGACHELARDL